MKSWSAVGLLAAAWLLSSCSSLTAPGGDSQWYTIGAKLRDFGGFRFAQDGTPLYYSGSGGNLRYTAALNLWESVETPGGYGAVYEVARDGTEFVSSYGMYTRASSTAPWTLIPGSRALRLQYAALDRDGSLYAVVDALAKPPPPGSSRIYVKLKGSSAWTAVSGLPASYAAASVGVDPLGRAYVFTTTLGFQFQGALAISLPQPQAQAYDFAGERYFVPPLGAGTTIQKVNLSGALEPWVNFGGVGTSTVLRLIGFGKDGRFYALAGFNSALGFDFTKGDIIAISPSAPKWTRVASSVLDGAGNRTGPALAIDAYSSSFSPEGGLYFFGAESGNLEMFSYGVYRLKFGGNP